MPTSTPPSLLTWAAFPTGPRPLPDSDRRIYRGSAQLGYHRGWPARLLARAELAADMADRGVEYARKVGRARGGFTINGEPALANEVARVAVDIIREAADLMRDGNDELTDDASALDWTADDLEESARAESNFLGALRPLLPSPVADEVDAYLATHDNRGDVAQPDLWAAYRAAGTPGALGRNRLYERAADRWETAKTHSARVFRTSTPRASEENLAAELADLVDRYGRAAILTALGVTE